MNLNKQIAKIQESLKSKGFVKDIPLVTFKTEIMIQFGMTRKKVNEWTRNYQSVGLISIKGDNVNFNG